MINNNSRIKFGKVLAIIIMSSLILAGCDSKEAEDESEVTVEDTSSGVNKEVEQAMEAAEAIAAEQQQLAEQETTTEDADSDAPKGLTSADVLGNPTPTPVDQTSNIPSNINVSRNNNGSISGANSTNDGTDTPIPTTPDGKRTTPQVFDIGDCMVEVGGDYSSANCDAIIARVNQLRSEYNIPLCSKNTGLCKVADRRVKELKYFWGPIRPDGTPWNSIAPTYYQAECMVCTTALGGVSKAGDGLVSGTISRKNLMDENYLSIGASYFQSGDLVYVVVSMGY